MGAPIARHLIIELGGCPRSVLDDPARMRALLEDAAAAAATTVLRIELHHFTPHGVTGIALLAESHVAIHTWPETGYAAVDLMTCRADSDLDRVVACVRAAADAAQVDVRVIERARPRKDAEG